MIKPVAPACQRNRVPILAVLNKVFAQRKKVLEIGSGTGEHGVYFSQHMPWLTWQCSDLAENLDGISQWVIASKLANLPQPIELDVRLTYPGDRYDAIFSANSLHIMSMTAVEKFFHTVSAAADASCSLVVYGPFNYQGAFTSDSNARFDDWLQQRDPASGIRDFEWVNQLATAAGFSLIEDHEMPANNRCLHWEKSPDDST